MAYTIAVSNEKGGVAKTTTTLSLGAALAELNHRVLLIDLDPQSNLSLALGLETGEAEITTANILIENEAIKTAIRKTEVANLDLVPSNSRIENAEQYLPMRSHYLTTLRNALKAGPLPYDYVLLDCPPALGAITLNALSAGRPIDHSHSGRVFFSLCVEKYDGLHSPCATGRQPKPCLPNSCHITGSSQPYPPQYLRTIADNVWTGCFYNSDRN